MIIKIIRHNMMFFILMSCALNLGAMDLSSTEDGVNTIVLKAPKKDITKKRDEIFFFIARLAHLSSDPKDVQENRYAVGSIDHDSFDEHNTYKGELEGLALTDSWMYYTVTFPCNYPFAALRQTYGTVEGVGKVLHPRVIEEILKKVPPEE